MNQENSIRRLLPVLALGLLSLAACQSEGTSTDPDGGATGGGNSGTGSGSGGTAAGPGKGTGGNSGTGGSASCLDRPQCDLFCEHGNQVDQDGCELCKCNPAPGGCALRDCGGAPLVGLACAPPAEEKQECVRNPAGTCSWKITCVTPSSCPLQPPEAGGECKRPGLACEYGDDPRPACRTTAVCASVNRGDVWQVTSPRCTALPPVECPKTLDAARDQACRPMDAYCSYQDGLSCHCTNCTDRGPVSFCNGDPVWQCMSPNMTPGCPAGMPRLGSACKMNGLACMYTCGEEGGRTCEDGAWVPSAGGPCAISTRSAKRDIQYLGGVDVARLARQVEELRLARYHYRDPALGAGERLGFIIEDSPGVAAIEKDGRSVDLYAYSSMLAAALQEQARRIRTLEAEVKSLRHGLPGRRGTRRPRP